MKRLLSRISVSALLITGLILSLQPWTQSTGVAAGRPGVTLLAEDQQHSVTAELGDQVTFRAISTGGLPKGEYIAILSGGKLMGAPCSKTPCTASASYDSAHTATYEAVVYTKSKSLAHSLQITVTWKALRLLVKVSSVVKGTLQRTSKEPLIISQLAGLPVTLNVSTPDGVATTWNSIQVVPLDNSVLPEPCAADRCELKFSVVGNEETFLVKELNNKGVDEKTVGPLTIKPRDWAVTIEATGKNGKSDTQLTADRNEQVQLTALITEPNAQSLRTYVTTEISADEGGGFGTVKKCSQSLTCTVSASDPKPGEDASVNYSGGALVTSGTKTEQPGGESQALTVSWYAAPTGFYSIQYKIIGGSGDCSPAPPEGYSSCHPGPGGTVQLYASVSFSDTENGPSNPATSLPSGYRIVWNSHPDVSGSPDVQKALVCPMQQPTCTVTVPDPGGGLVVDFQAEVENANVNILAYWTLNLTVNWN